MGYCTTCDDFFHVDCMSEPAQHDEDSEIPLEVRIERSLIKRLPCFDGYIDQVHDEARYDGVPAELVDLARSRLRRGREFGVAGNLRAVGEARERLAEHVVRRTQIGDDWMRVMGIDKDDLEFYTTHREAARACPRCQQPV